MVRGKGIRIDLKEELDSNRTYVLNFGQCVRDNNEGNPYTGLRYVFSTGDYIDSMIMSGYTANAQTGDSASNVFIYFYEALSDSVEIHDGYDSTIFLHKPQNVARSFPNGIFIAENLKPVPYRIYALEDKNSNMQYEPGVDKIGFLDSIYNPADMPSFDMWYDTSRKYMVADPQIMINMFMDTPFKRHNLTTKSRPARNKLIFEFLAPYPQIDTIRFDGIEPSEIITEYATPRHDTIIYWLDVPADRLPDTLKGRIVYQKHDSVGQLYTHGEDLKMYYRTPPQPKQKQTKDDKEEVEKNPFKVKVTADKILIPEKDILFSFDYPLRHVDSNSILLEKITEERASVAQEATTKVTEVKVDFKQDTLYTRDWRLKADWKPDEKYKLTIPAGVFENIMGEKNDTLQTEFSIDTPDKYSTIILNITGKTPESKYIIELVNEQNKRPIKELKDVSTGTYTIQYIPAGDVMIKITEDLNGNGKWDEGSLIERRQSERIEFFINDDGKNYITAKENWELTFDIDMNKIFTPVNFEYIQQKMLRLEEARRQRIAEELLEKEKEKQQSQHNH